MTRSAAPAPHRNASRRSQASGASARSRAEKPTMHSAAIMHAARNARRCNGSSSSAYGRSGDRENVALTVEMNLHEKSRSSALEGSPGRGAGGEGGEAVGGMAPSLRRRV